MEAVAITDKVSDEILAVILFNAHYGHFLSMHIASNGAKRWVSRFAARAVFGYAFEHKGVTRINAVVPAWNVPVQILCLKFGFRIEGTMRCGADDGSDAILFGMLRQECRWIEDREAASDGQEQHA